MVCVLLNIYIKEVSKRLDEEIGWILCCGWFCFWVMSLFGLKPLSWGEAVIYVSCRREVTHLAKTTQPSTGVMSTKNHKVNSEGDQSRAESKLLLLPLTLSCAHKHTQTQKKKSLRASPPSLMFVHLFLFAQQEMHALPQSMNKHGHTHSHTMHNKPDSKHMCSMREGNVLANCFSTTCFSWINEVYIPYRIRKTQTGGCNCCDKVEQKIKQQRCLHACQCAITCINNMQKCMVIILRCHSLPRFTQSQPAL